MKDFFTINLLLFISVFFLLTGCSNQSDSDRNKNGLNTFDSSSINKKEYNGYVVSDEGAWCWFADPRAIHYQNKKGTINSTYIGYIDVHGNIKATQHNFNTGQTSEVLIRSYFQPDDHNNPSFLVLPDERIMIFYSRHTDEAYFYYRVSQNPGDITTLGAERKIETNYNTTYPSPFILSDDPNHFYMCWRGIKWHPTIARFTIPDKLDQVSLDWGPYQLIQSTAVRPYCKYYSNSKDKIYLAYTTGHPDNEYPNYLYFNYIDINTRQLKDVEGTLLSAIEKGPHFINKTDYPVQHPKAVVDSSSDKRNWVWQTVLDKEGYPVIAMVQINRNKTDHNYYYVKWTGKEWQKTFVANGGGHFHQSDGLELCYSGGVTIDDSNPKEIYCSVPISTDLDTVYEIKKFIINNKGEVISSEQITHNSRLNNIRPFKIANSANSPLKLVWMHGNYYDWIVSSVNPHGFPTAIHCDYDFPEESIDFDNGHVINEQLIADKKLSAQNKSLDITLPSSAPDSFSISVTACIRDDTNESIIIKIGNLIYGVRSINQKPYIIIDNAIYNSTNLMGNSDSWKNEDRATSGKWYPPQKLDIFNLTLTCKDNLLKVYRDGLIDQVVELSSPVLGNKVQGGAAVWIKNYRIYNRIINQSEIKELVKIKNSYSDN